MRAATSMTGLNEMYRLAREDISWLLERLRAAEGKNADLLSAASAANAKATRLELELRRPSRRARKG